MILRLSTAAERGAVAVIAAICAAFLAFLSIRNAAWSYGNLSNLQFNDVCHIVPLQASTAYNFFAWVHTRDLSTYQSVHFVLHDLSRAAPAVTTVDARGSMDWQQINLQWTAPPGAQEAQVCLARSASDQSDNKIRGTLWVDDVALVPIPSGTPKP
jgi:hypothetical protein